MRMKTGLLLAQVMILIAACRITAFAAPQGGKVIVYPEDGTSVKSQRPATGADYRNVQGAAGLEPQLLLDGKDVTSECGIEPGYIFFMPGSDLPAGAHEVELRLSSKGKPAMQPVKWKFTIGVQTPSGITYPENGITADSARPVIGINFSQLPSPVNPDTVRLFVNDEDVTRLSSITGDSIFFRPPSDMPDGAHTVTLRCRASSGAAMDPVSWSFNISSAEGPGSDAVASAAGKRRGSAAIITKASKHSYSIANAAKQVEALYPPPVEYRTAPAGETDYARGEQGSAGETAEEKAPEKINVKEYAQEMGINLGMDYALETMLGYEIMNVGGDYTRSSQFERNAIIHSIGLRTQQNLLNPALKLGVFSVNMKMTGTNDGDESESLWDLKNLVVGYKADKFNIQMYDLHPKYTPYSLSGKSLLGLQYDATIGNDKTLNFFVAKFKKDTAGKKIQLAGMRYAVDRPEQGLAYGAHYVLSSMKYLRSGDKYANSVFGFDVDKKQKNGETSLEWASSRYSEIGQDSALRVENKYKKGKLYTASAYQDVGNLFRSEAGLSSKGLTETQSTVQYRVSDRLTVVSGFKNRAFKEGGSTTFTVPFVMKAKPLKNREDFNFEYKRNMSKYAKSDSTKDTLTTTLTIRDTVGDSKLLLSRKDEKKVRNTSEDETEQITDFRVDQPVSLKLNATYKLSMLRNNLYGPETSNEYSFGYELSDWSDVNLAIKTINKDNPYLDREARKLRFGKVNPETNTELSFELMQNIFIDYDETYSAFKYSKFY